MDIIRWSASVLLLETVPFRIVRFRRWGRVAAPFLASLVGAGHPRTPVPGSRPSIIAANPANPL
jgi:hypothetical protein